MLVRTLIRQWAAAGEEAQAARRPREIAERPGWAGGHSVLRARVAELRPTYLPADPCQRTEYRPGELAQWDLWFPAPRIPLGHGQVAVLPVIVGVSGYSRVMAARMIRTITDPVHDAARKAMAAATNPPCEHDVELDEVEVPDLSAYDRTTGAA